MRDVHSGEWNSDRVLCGFIGLAIVSAMDMTNGGLYASLMNQYGTKEESGAFVLMSLESGPLMTMLILGSLAWPR
jgi:2-keto-3-deoxygluconate permease